LITGRIRTRTNKLSKDQTIQIANEAARGTVSSASESDAQVADLAEIAVAGTTRALMQVSDVRADDIVRAASFGAVQGAIQAAESPRQAVESSIVRAASEAESYGLSIELAVEAASEGALQAASELLNPDQYAIVAEVVSATRSSLLDQ
jgi:hypothetical protein